MSGDCSVLLIRRAGFDSLATLHFCLDNSENRSIVGHGKFIFSLWIFLTIALIGDVKKITRKI